MDSTLNQREEKNKRTGAIFSGIFHVILFVLALLPFLTFPDPPPGQEGILVNLGIPDVGQGDENAPKAAAPEPVEVPEPVKETQPEKPEPVKETKPEPITKPKETTPAEKNIVETEDPQQIALRKKREEEKKKQEEANRKKLEEERAEKLKEEARKRAEAEAKARAEAEAKAKAEAEAAEKKKFEDAKNKFGSLFGGGNDEGKGKTGTSGNQGDPGGDPNSDILEGISTGSGRVGGGLGNRGGAGPGVTENSQETGVVVIRVCVDPSGTVTSATYTQKGSTTTNSTLVNAAIGNAKKWKFKQGSVDTQCGTITYDFRVR